MKENTLGNKVRWYNVERTICDILHSRSRLDEETVMETLIMQDIDADIETEDDAIVVYGQPQDLFRIKDAIKEVKADVNFDIEEIAMLPKDTVNLEGDDKELFEKLLKMLDDVEDVQNVYHNVNM